jgi:hypothetical protein
MRIPSRPLAALALLALAACAGPPYVDRNAAEPGLLAMVVEPVVYAVGRRFAETPPRCIAILPFTVASSDVDADAWRRAKQVRHAIYAHLAPLPPRDVELARVDALLDGLSPAARRSYPLLGRRLACDALLLGTLLESRERYLGLYSEIAVGAELELVRASDGEVLWQAHHIASSRGGALPISPMSALEGVISAASNLLGEERARVTDDLARRLVRALPEAELFAAVEPAGDR